MDEYDSEQYDRDKTLLDRLCSQADAMRWSWREWMEEEVRALLSRGQALDAITTGQPVNQTVKGDIEAVERIMNREMKGVFERLTERVQEIKGELYGKDLLTWQGHLQDVFGGVRDLARQMQEIRERFDTLWGQGYRPPEPDD